jgi:hypothetical protein
MKKIVSELKKAYKKYRLPFGTVSAHTKSAKKITREWQESVESKLIKKEVPVPCKNNEKIDLIDRSSMYAYEAKISGNNTHHEFYKDVAKVLTYNEYESKKIKKLVFLSEQKGIRQLENRLDQKFRSLIKRKHNVGIELVPIN